MLGASSVARRYAPFLVLAAVQVLLVALVPSTGGPASDGGVQVDAGDGFTGADDGLGGDLGPTGTAAPGDGGVVAGTAPVGTGGTGGAASTSGPGPQRNAVGRALTTAAGDRSKCAKDGVRQQDITLSSPPCVPKFTGDNGGATYKQGVTATEVKVLRYRAKADAQVELILRSQGLASSREEEDAAMNAFARFFEKRYELYNRKIKWVTVQGECTITPPDLPCFRDEAKRLNTAHKPFAVFWMNNTNVAEWADEWSKLGVINDGGWHFNAAFNEERRPFHYDVFMDGTRTALNIADYWCKKMQGKNATLAGTPDLQAKRRKLGILTQDFPVTRKNALDLHAMVTGGKCGASVDAAEPVYTPSNIGTAQTTARTAMEKLKNDGVTTVVLMVDPINPVFSSKAASELAWQPEWLLSGAGLIDYDLLGRLYDQTQWVRAFGPGHLGEPIPFNQSDAARAAADVGVNEVYSGANLLFAYMSLVAAQVQMSGPTLTPPNVERGLLTLPPAGGWDRTKNPASVLVKYGPGDYTAIEDSRHAIWEPNLVSKIDGKPGAYRAVEGGRRWEIGEWATGEPKQ